MNIYVHKVYVTSDTSVADELKGFLRGQWVNVNGMTARIANHVGDRVVLWMTTDKMFAVFR